MLVNQYCPNCEKVQTFIFSGSGTKGSCMACNYHLPPEEKWKGSVIYYDG